MLFRLTTNPILSYPTQLILLNAQSDNNDNFDIIRSECPLHDLGNNNNCYPYTISFFYSGAHHVLNANMLTYLYLG